MAVLVTGGAGYIGSHAVKLLIHQGYKVVVLDNLSTGHRWAVPNSVKFYELDYGVVSDLEKVFSENQIDAVLHFGGFIEVEESTREPLKYFENNTVNAFVLLKFVASKGVKKFIFSSTCATYGEPEKQPIAETTPQNPVNPYGQSKLLFEKMMIDFGKAQKDFRYIIFRYFNIAGASPDGEIGHSYPRSTHLIKVAAQTAIGKRDKISVFGTDYPTHDGTCIRDYIHVMDLAQAHIDGLKYLEGGGVSEILNCGYGKGYSVDEVIGTMKKVTGKDFKVNREGRRAGDPPELVCDTTKFMKVLGTKWKYNDINVICKSAYDWELKGK